MWKAVIYIFATFLIQILCSIFLLWMGMNPTEMPRPISIFTIIAFGIEAFIEILVLFLCAVWIYDLKKSSLMHWNLKIVCYLISFHIITACVLKFIINFDNLTGGKYMSRECKFVITAIRGTATIHFMLDHAAATLERALATFKVAKYEKTATENSWLSFCFARELIAIIFYYLASFTVIGAISFGIFWIILEVFIGITGIILYKVNLRSYKTSIGTLRLTTRYQTIENIRCLKPVLLYTLIAFLENMISFGLLIFLVTHLLAENFDGAMIIQSSLDVIVAIFCMCFPLSFLIYSSRIRKAVNVSSTTATTTSTPIFSVMGKAMATKNEQNIYFNELKKAWK